MVSEELRKKIESALDKGGLQGVWKEAQKEERERILKILDKHRKLSEETLHLNLLDVVLEIKGYEEVKE